MFRCAAEIGLALALAGCTDQVVLPDMASTSDAGVNSKDAWPGSDAGCLVPASATYKSTYPQLLILLDRSADMQRQFAVGATRESAAQSALTAQLSAYQTRIKFGFRDFPADPTKFQCSPGTCCLNPVIGLAPGLNLAARVSSDIQCADSYYSGGCPTPSVDSPSNAALAQARDDYKNVSTDDGVYVLLVTASEPSCSADSRDPCVSARNAAGALGDMGIHIIVLSVGYQPDPGSSCLYQIAGRGFQTPSDDLQPVYPASNTNDLSNAVSDVFSAVARNACTLSSTSALPPTGVLPTVYIGQTYIPFDSQDGWSYAAFSRTKITFSGSACKTWLGSGSQLTNPDVSYLCSLCGGPNACTSSWP